MRHYANGIAWELKEECDGWWSIYKIHPVTQALIPQIQAKDLKHAYSYCAMIEPFTVPMQRIC